MALIKCPKCGKDISDKALSCPNCASTLSSKSKIPKTAIITIIIIALIICGIWLISDNDSKKDSSTTSYKTNSTYSNYSYTPKTGNAGAVEQAKSYLRSSAFSYLGLIDQLEFEGFSESEAKYGADNCGANWKEQALKSAKSYLKSSAFSYSGLLDQLLFEEFTESEAKYGVDNCGADWNEQAVKSAASYLRSSTFTRSELIDQLEFEGFTYSQAVYGVEQNGY